MHVLNHTRILQLLFVVALIELNAQGGNAVRAQDASTPKTEDLSLDALTKNYTAIANARDLIKKRPPDRKQALELLVDLVSKKPELPPAQTLLASLLLAENQARLGIVALDEAIEKHPNDPEAYLILAGFALSQNRRTETALLLRESAREISSFKGSAQRKENLVMAYYNMAASLAERREKWESAKKHLKTMVDIRPENVTIRVRLARTMFRLKEGSEAFAELTKAHELGQKKPTPVAIGGAVFRSAPVPAIAIARFYVEQQELEQAETWYAHAEKKNADDAQARFALAQWKWSRGDGTAAAEHSKAAMRLDPEFTGATALSGMIAHYQHHLKQAENHLKTALKQDESNFRVRNQMAWVLIAQDNPVKTGRALELAEESVKRFPKNTSARATLGWVQFRLGHYNEAARNLQTAARGGRLDPDTAYFVAQLLKHNKRTDQARQLLTNVLKSKALFVHRKDAKKLLTELGG